VTEAALAGVGVVVTRDEPVDGPLARKLAAAGARVLAWPAVAIAPPADPAPLAGALSELETFDWLVVTSAHAVEAVAERRASLPSHLRVAAVGDATAEAARRAGWRVDRVPSEFRGEALVEAFRAAGDARGARVLFPAADRALPTVPDGLAALGAEVVRVEAYRTAAAPLDAAACARAAATAPLVLTFASPSAVDGLAGALGEAVFAALVDGAATAVIGPTTAEALRRHGRAPDATAEPHTLDGLVAAAASAALALSRRSQSMSFPRQRPRRLRANAAWRSMVAETTLTASDLVYPLFVVPGEGIANPVASMPGVAQLSIDRLVEEARRAHALGVPAVILFGIPEHKDPEGSSGYAEDGIVPRAVRALKQELPTLLVWADVCLCEYTSHGHCGLLTPEGAVDNDATLPLLARAAVAYAKAGADAVAPSDMMDGRVAAIRAALDAAGFAQTPIVAYAAKYASAYYGPFRDAAQSAPAFGDRRAYQMDPANADEALREVALDVEEGADIVMVKPAGPYLDIVRRVKETFRRPTAAYQVSGEYSLIKAAAANGWVDERRMVLESLIGIRRAGADMVLTYFAPDVAAWLAEDARR